MVILNEKEQEFLDLVTKMFEEKVHVAFTMRYQMLPSMNPEAYEFYRLKMMEKFTNKLNNEQ